MEKQDFLEFIRPVFMNPLIQGHYGVDVYFVISGFLIGSLLIKEWQETKEIRFSAFYLRRAFRLLPAYFVAMFAFAILIGTNVRAVWANLLYVNNYLPLQKQFMGWTWSLAIEEQFYLVCPGCALLLDPGNG